jgi:hypothetical protein
MSQENVEIVRRAWRAYNDEGIEAATEYLANDCVCEDVVGLPDGATIAGGKGCGSGTDTSKRLGGIGLGAAGRHGCGPRDGGRGDCDARSR